jgi:hypothetical protein
MAQNAERPADRGDGISEAREDQSGRIAVPEHTQEHTWPQDRVIAVFEKNKRARHEVFLRTFDAGVRRVVIASRDANGIGGWRNTGPTLTFAPSKIDALIEALQDAKNAAIEEGHL